VARLDAKTVVAFIQHYAQDHGRSSAHYVTRALRSFLRFLQHRGYVAIDLASAAPRVACLRATEWVVYAKRPFAGPEQVLDYVGAILIAWRSLTIVCWTSRRTR